MLALYGIAKCNGRLSQFPVNRAFWIAQSWLSQLQLYVVGFISFKLILLMNCVLCYCLFFRTPWDSKTFCISGLLNYHFNIRGRCQILPAHHYNCCQSYLLWVYSTHSVTLNMKMWKHSYLPFPFICLFLISPPPHTHTHTHTFHCRRR
jgi:hypothetical protein